MQELHWLREEHAKKFDYDVYAIAMDGEMRGKFVREKWERQQKEWESKAE